MPRSIELLSPARNLECGIEAVRHGADAVYIGAPRFGARAAAGNSVADIEALVRYAHVFGVSIYVTVNTLLYDDEVAAVDSLIDELQAAGVDALIVQDPRVATINHGRLPLHASTQMDNRTVADVRARLEAGYEQTVLARELSLDDIRAIHAAVPAMPLEAFVHGALCVSYSGRCYASEYCFSRSANRGECAQFCRLPFDLTDADGRVVIDPRSGRPLRQRHLLSLRDMNRAADLEAMMDAGVTSFKIEGRLKDVSYVKNTTAYYRQRIDAIIERRPDEFCRSSYGRSTFIFTPDLLKSFNRRFTDYFLHGRTSSLSCFATPKAIGEPVGTVKDVRLTPASLSVAGTHAFANGDGLCFFDADDRLQGFRVNRVDDHGRLFPADPSALAALHKGTPLYRNVDAAFERLLSRPSADRRLAVSWLIADAPGGDGFCLTLTAEDGRTVTRRFDYPHETARTPQADNLRRQLSRLGDTPFATDASAITIALSADSFIPSSVLADWRRALCDALLAMPVVTPSAVPSSVPSSAVSLQDQTPMTSGSAPSAEPASPQPSSAAPLMTCRFCLRHALGYCTRDGRRLPWPEPLSLRLADGRSFPLRFDCRRCEMQVLRPSQESVMP